MTMHKDELTESLRQFKQRRDDLLHEDIATFDHHYERFLEFCKSDFLVQSVLSPLLEKHKPDADSWWQRATTRPPRTSMPSNSDEELSLLYRLLESADDNADRVSSLGIAHGHDKQQEWVEFFRTLIIRPFAAELSNRLATAANLATPEARAAQAVPFTRIPSQKEIRIFLSHKSVDKPLVYRYHHALKATGFDPWLDETNMAAGANLEREVLRGFEESCAAVFFITENFRDEKYLAAEVDYAVMQKRKKDKKFAIITLRYANAAEIPGLLTPYIYKDITNDLQGFKELVAALPIELGPCRWKADVV
jgi:hypothetical protein